MKTANNCFLAKGTEIDRKWFVVDATDQVLGRLAARIATVLMGKHHPTYTPHVDTGDFVVVINTEKVKLTGRKMDQITYEHYTRHPSGLKSIPVRRMLDRHPERVLQAAVRRMLPKNALSRHMLMKLKLYKGPAHPHQAQTPEPFPN